MSYHGKVIYQPTGKAAEYSAWAANFFNGCSARCEYCFNRKGITAKVLGGDNPVLKKTLIDTYTAKEIFKKELNQNLSELQKNGLFFNFVSDPCLPETFNLNWVAILLAIEEDVKCKVLTKQAWWVDWFLENFNSKRIRERLDVGFTLTGHDDLEPGASTNAERIQAMKKLHNAGFKTYGSFEPIIDFNKTLEMINATKDFLDHFKIGLLSGSKPHYELVRDFLDEVFELIPTKPIYLKDSILKAAGIKRDSFDLPKNCVDRTFNL